MVVLQSECSTVISCNHHSHPTTPWHCVGVMDVPVLRGIAQRQTVEWLTLHTCASEPECNTCIQ